MIVQRLQHFGYSEQEGKVYLTLLQYGKLTGYEISKKSGIARSKIYNLLEQLCQKGIVLVSHSEPKLYSALAAAELIERIRLRTSQNLAHLEKELSTISLKDRQDYSLWSLANQQDVLSKVKYLIATSQESLYLQIWEEDLTEDLLALLMAAESRLGHSLVILFSADGHKKVPLQHCYYHGFLHDKLQDMGSRWINLIVDNSSVLFGTLGEDKEVIWTKNKAMLMLAKEYVKHDAYTLKIIDDFPDLLQERYGQQFEKIRDIY